MSTESAAELVSVVVATYNMGHYLPLAVQSVLNQEYPYVEVLVVDDGSTDDTPSVVLRWEGEPRVRVHRQPNGGQARAKNKGIALSRGQFVAFLDADDVWLPGKLAWQMPLFHGRPTLGVVYSDFERMDVNGRPLPKGPVRMHRGHISGPLLIDNFISFPSAVVRRECLKRHGVFDETLGMGIDYDLWLRLSAHCEFDFVPEATVRYRIWSGQMSKNYRQRYESGIKIMQNFIDRNPGAVDRAVLGRAWAHTYTGRGNSILWHEKDRRAAFRDYIRALSFRPVYWPAWRAMLRSLITARAPS
jgi:glycosyltransferase involved in cell wall biosynthesis